jgi:hypothetical protein
VKHRLYHLSFSTSILLPVNSSLADVHAVAKQELIDLAAGDLGPFIKATGVVAEDPRYEEHDVTPVAE